MRRQLDVACGWAGALVALFCLVFTPISVRAEEVWSPSEEEMAAVGGPLQALAALRSELETGPINLCGLVADHTNRTQLMASATGNAVTLRCSGLGEPVVLTYRQRALFGLDAVSRSDRLMLCETRDGGAIYARQYSSDEWSCINTAGKYGRYDRDRLRRFVTAWTYLSRAAGTQPPDEASTRAAVMSAPALTPEIEETLRRTQVQVELAIRENRLLDAAGLYSAALNATPNWSGGQFNHALVLGELEFYPSAVFRMRTYLALSPDAPDARAARDKIYEWEARISSGAAPSRPASQ
ncbi:MAG TPA: hypothetical protein VFT98_18380 [Myxococcota bacterium]|nr:hypothetical protein [Myxococcota bacterium]